MTVCLLTVERCGYSARMSILVYGVSGYTGALVSCTAKEASVEHIAASRNPEKVRVHADECEVEARVFGLDDPAAVDEGLRGVSAVVNCAGPFARTAEPLLQGCLRAGIHYMDLAGEVPEHEHVQSFDEAAREAGSMLVPRVGFGVVPTECIAAILAEKVAEPARLVLSYETQGAASRGTLETVLLAIHKSGVQRVDGALIEARPGKVSRKVDFGDGKAKVVTNPWRADLISAFVSTGIGNIETYATFPGVARMLMRSGWLMNRKLVQRMFRWVIRRAPEGPTAKQLASGYTRVLGELEAADGTVTRASLRGPEAYVFTARAAVAAAAQVLDGAVKPGFQTPSTAFGARFVESIEGVEVQV